MPELAPEGEFEIVSVNVSERTGVRKRPVASGILVEGSGLAGDAHSYLPGLGGAPAQGLEIRQVSLLAVEEIEAASALLAARSAPGAASAGPAGSGSPSCSGYASTGEAGEAPTALVPGDFAENLTIRGLALHELPLGTRLTVGEAILEVSKIGKECHAACEIRRLVGDCVMPRKGIFARVVQGGEVVRGSRGHYRLG